MLQHLQTKTHTPSCIQVFIVVSRYLSVQFTFLPGPTISFLLYSSTSSTLAQATQHPLSGPTTLTLKRTHGMTPVSQSERHSRRLLNLWKELPSTLEDVILVRSLELLQSFCHHEVQAEADTVANSEDRKKLDLSSIMGIGMYGISGQENYWR